MLERLKSWARAVKRDIVALWIAARDPRTPLPAKVVAGVVLAYALSPVDLIPDFIPVLGYLDDLILVPLGVLAVVALIPRDLMAEYRAAATERGRLPASRAGLVVIVLIWLAAAIGVAWYAKGIFGLQMPVLSVSGP